jgi:cytochrome c oxidase assembly protein subunit 15
MTSTTTPGSRPIALWLLTGCLLIAATVTIGGITRLTGSGLSITEWNVIMGALPPRGEAEWAELFRKYQAIPQFQTVNAHFTLEDFKSIFWWEYIHRLVGRGIGIVFLVPFVIFVARGWLRGPLLRKVLLILGLGLFQGVLGWFMVASGLSERTSVSHYRLAAHLLTALVTLAVTLWVALDLLPHGHGARPVPTVLRTQLRLFGALLGVQIGYGALVAGLKAGFAYNTFPLMGGRWVPDGVWQLSPRWVNLFENPATVQFVHRALAWLLAVFGVWLWHTLRVHGLRRRANLLLAAVATQFLLGVLTIIQLPVRPVLWGAAHQAGAVALLVATVLGLHAVTRDTLTTTHR